MNGENKTILAFGAHPDDVEFGCGGTLLLLKEKGYDVTIIDLTKGEAAQSGLKKRLKEAKKASKILKITRKTFNFGDKKITLSQNHKLEIKRIIQKYNPLFAFAPYFIDKHLDHINTAKLVSQFIPTIHYFISDVEKENFGVNITKVYKKKIQALLAHKSQIYHGDIEWVEKRHKSYGTRLGVEWGELFFIKKNILLPNIFQKL